MSKSFWRQITSSKSNLFFYCLILFIAGVFLGNFFAVAHFYIFCALLFLLFALVVYWRKKFCFYVFLFLCFLVFGFWRFNLTSPDYGDDRKIYHYSSSTVEFIGRIKNIENRGAGQQITVRSESLKTPAGYRPAGGLVLVSQPLYPQRLINEKITVKCLLERPGKIEDFDYGKYLAKSGIFITCAFAEATSVGQPSGWSAKVLFFRFKDYLTRSLNASISEPEVSLLRGMLLGDGRGLPADKSQMFSDLGLAHIIAISGDHIAIVAAVLLQLLIAFGVSRPKAFWPLAGIIAFYVLLVGAPASAVRAAVMALGVMYAQKIGRAGQIKNVLVLAASAMILLNPRILLSDVGFQLSFMAVWGLSYISPLFNTYLQKMPDFARIKEILTATLSAQIATLPLTLFYFGKLSPVSVIANILVLPIIPFLTVWGLANLIAAAVCLPLGQAMGWVSWLFCAYWIEVSELLHRIPFGYFNLGDFGLVWLVIFYGLIFSWYWSFSSSSRRNKSMV